MRILHVINGLSASIGGPQITLAALAPAQVKRGHEVVVLSARLTPPPLSLELSSDGKLTVCEVPTHSENKWFNPQVLNEVRRRARNCDLVHVHGNWRYHLLAAAKVCREYGIPYIIRPAGNLDVVSAGHKSYLKRPYFRLFERRVFNRAAAIHCTSSSEANQIHRLRLETPTFVVPNAVPLETRTITNVDGEVRRVCPEIEPSHEIVLYLGRIAWIKNLEALVDAFAILAEKYPSWRLVLAGTHEQRSIVERLQKKIAVHKLHGRVFVPGAVFGNAKIALLRRAAIFAQPSLHENFGISVAEALFYGLPCVVSTGVAIGSDLVQGDAGLMCAGNAAALSQALEKLMSDPELRAKYSRNALDIAAAYQPERVAAELDVQYESCINGVAARPTRLTVPVRSENEARN